MRWIRLHVSILDHDLFADAPLTEREAWIWMIANAAWRETKHRVGNTMHVVPVGSFFCTIRQLQEAWQWTSTRRVHAFFALLKSETMIETSSETGKTLVSICNYEKYQVPNGSSETGFETRSETDLKQKRNTKDTNTPKIDNNSLRSLSSGDDPKPRKRGSRLPEDFEPDREWSRAQGLSNNLLRSEFEKFKDYWISQPGQKGVKQDWQATWRNWIRRVSENQKGQGRNSRPKQETAFDVYDKIAELKGWTNEPSGIPSDGENDKRLSEAERLRHAGPTLDL